VEEELHEKGGYGEVKALVADYWSRLSSWGASRWLTSAVGGRETASV